MQETGCNREIPDDARFEILKRLPAKSLMRFKCVCKTWRDIIEDRFFAHQHHVESKSRPDASYILFFGEGYHVGFRNTCKESIIPVKNSALCTTDIAVCTTDIAGLKFAEYTLCTRVVEGLVCMSDKDDTLTALNVTTGEKLLLPPGVKKESDSFRPYSCPLFPHYFLGFDPLNKNYKLLKFSLGIKFCQILTLGENSWREIDPLRGGPLKDKIKRVKSGVSVNGCIYWAHGLQEISYFDVHAEKFMQLDLPHGVECIYQLTRVADKLGLLCSMGTECLVFWTLSPTKIWKIKKMPRLGNLIDENEIIGTIRDAWFLWKHKDFGCLLSTSLDYPPSNSEEVMLRTIDVKVTYQWVNSSKSSLVLSLRGASCDHVENILPLKTLSSGDKKD